MHRLKQYVCGNKTQLIGSSLLEVISSNGDNRTTRFKLTRRTCSDANEVDRVMHATEAWLCSNGFTFVGYSTVDDKGCSKSFEAAPAYAVDMCLLTWRCVRVCSDFQAVAMQLAEKAELGIVARTSEIVFSAADVTITVSDFHDVPNAIGPAGTGAGQFVAQGQIAKLLLWLIALKHNGCEIELTNSMGSQVGHFSLAEPYWVDVRPMAVRIASKLGIVRVAASTQPVLVW